MRSVDDEPVRELASSLVDQRNRLFGVLWRLRFEQSHARATAIVVDEDHAGLFEGALDDLSGRAAGLT